MQKLEKAITTADQKPHEHEAAIQALFTAGDAESGRVIQDARAAGMSWPAIIALLVQYGPQFVGILQAILAAWRSPPPAPPAPTPTPGPTPAPGPLMTKAEARAHNAAHA